MVTPGNQPEGTHPCDFRRPRPAGSTATTTFGRTYFSSSPNFRILGLFHLLAQLIVLFIRHLPKPSKVRLRYSSAQKDRPRFSKASLIASATAGSRPFRATNGIRISDIRKLQPALEAGSSTKNLVGRACFVLTRRNGIDHFVMRPKVVANRCLNRPHGFQPPGEPPSPGKFR